MILEFQKFQKEDFEQYYKLVGNEKVMAMITERAILLDEGRSEYKKLLLNNEIHPRFGSYKIIDKKSGNFIGLAKFEIKEKNATEAELGYMLLPEYWGIGIGGKVAKKLIDMGKTESSIKKITAIIDPNNIPSRKILINNGFVSEKIAEIAGLPGEILGLTI